MLVLLTLFEAKIHQKTDIGISYTIYVKGSHIAVEIDGIRLIMKEDRTYVVIDYLKLYAEIGIGTENPILSYLKELLGGLDIEKITETYSTFSEYQQEFELEKTGETHIIDGYECEEYLAKDKETGQKHEICFSNDIPIPMRITTHLEDGRKETTEIHDIEETAIDPRVFEIPEDYIKLGEINIPILSK